MKTKLTLLAALAVSNLLWFNSYRAMKYDNGRTEAYLEISNNMLRAMPDSTVYQLQKTNEGELDVYCLNSGDATIRPVDSFGHITVSCGK